MSVENIEKFFNKIDADGDGSIALSEMNSLFVKFDKDGSGRLDAGEFTSGFSEVLGGTSEQAEKVFKALDTDNSGDVQLSELSDFFKKMDDDGSGEVSKDEFVKFWVSLLA